MKRIAKSPLKNDAAIPAIIAPAWLDHSSAVSGSNRERALAPVRTGMAYKELY